MQEENSVTRRQAQFTRHFAACERAMHAFAYSLIPNRADADDLIQDTLVALWEHFDDYDPDRPFLPWANRFVYRQVQMYRRSQSTRAKYFFSNETIERLAEDAPASLERDQAMSLALEKCLARLSETQRELIKQRYLARESLQEVAERTGRTPNTLYKTLQRIREKLHLCVRQGLKKEEFTP
jgi:RNA polymerase sigma-70 factor (ECF subfamily)